MNRTNVACLLLAVAGLSFGVGQSVGQDRADAGVQAAKVQRVSDNSTHRQLYYLYKAFIGVQDRLDKVIDQERHICVNVRMQNTPTPGTGSSDVVCPTP